MLPLPDGSSPYFEWPNAGQFFSVARYNDESRLSVFDPITKSSITASSYVAKTICDAPAYRVFSGNVSVNDMVDCVPVLSHSISIKGRVPISKSDDTAYGWYNGSTGGGLIYPMFLILRGFIV